MQQGGSLTRGAGRRMRALLRRERRSRSATAGAGRPARPRARPAAPPPAGAVAATLSNLKTLSRWAYPQAAAAAHQYPSDTIARCRPPAVPDAPTVRRRCISRCARTRIGTAHVDPGAAAGASKRCAPAGCRRARSAKRTSTHEYLRVDRETLRATLYRDGRAIWSAPVGVGQSEPAHPRRSLLRDREADCDRRAVLRPLRAGHERVCADAQRMAGRRRGGDPWNRRTAADPRPSLARLHPAAKRRHRPPVAADCRSARRSKSSEAASAGEIRRDARRVWAHEHARERERGAVVGCSGAP